MILLLLILLFVPQTEPTVITCSIVEVDQSVSCREESGTYLWRISGTPGSVSIWDEWRWTAPMRGVGIDPNMPLFQKQLVKGQQVLATIVDGELIPLASCEVRVHRRVNEWARAHPGDSVPFTMYEKPKDCGGGR